MKHLIPLLIVAISCSKSTPSNTPQVSKEPVSVRGWIADVESAPSASFKTVETEAARKAQLFQAANVWVENAPYVTGGIAENGAFILLDVPPGTTTIMFAAPGAPAAKLVLQEVPGNADIFIPALQLRPSSVALLDPPSVRIRMAARVQKPTPTKASAVIAGTRFPIIDTPYSAMTDRHEYPNPPGSFAPLPTLR